LPATGSNNANAVAGWPAQEALAEIAAVDEEEVARALVSDKLRSVRNLDKDKATRRLVGMLARKGHSPGLAYRVVAELLGDPS